MKFGLFEVESIGSTLEEWTDVGRRAEEAGFDAFFFGDNHGPQHHPSPEVKTTWGLSSAPMIQCMALAACTRRLRVGTNVVALPLRNAIEVAKEATAIDVLSQGRMILGVGSGLEVNGFHDYGVEGIARFSLLEEGVEVMRRAWTEGRFSFAGKRYLLKKVKLNLLPVQQPGIPIWVAARTKAGARRAARIGDALVTDCFTNLEETREFVSVYREICEKRGKKPYVVVMRSICMGSSQEEIRRQFEGDILRRGREYSGIQWLKEIEQADDASWERYVTDRVIQGTPEQCAQELERWQREVGIDYVIAEFPLAADGRKRMLEDVEVFGRDVIPRLSG